MARRLGFGVDLRRTAIKLLEHTRGASGFEIRYDPGRCNSGRFGDLTRHPVHTNEFKIVALGCLFILGEVEKGQS